MDLYSVLRVEAAHVGYSQYVEYRIVFWVDLGICTALCFAVGANTEAFLFRIHIL